MAVHVEDHPISYSSFEGTIPPRQYGAGKVIIWDKGIWTPIGDPQQSYKDGNLKFELLGFKMRSKWALIRIKSRDERQEAWLLIKEKDGYVKPAAEFSVVDQFPDSVKDLDSPAKPETSSLKQTGTAVLDTLTTTATPLPHPSVHRRPPMCFRASQQRRRRRTNRTRSRPGCV